MFYPNIFAKWTHDAEDLTRGSLANMDRDGVTHGSPDFVSESGNGASCRKLNGPHEYILPTVALLDRPQPREENGQDEEWLRKIGSSIEENLSSFGIKGKVNGHTCGPMVTTYAFVPDPGQKLSKILSLADDLSMRLGIANIHLQKSLLGQSAMGIQVPNQQQSMVLAWDVLADARFREAEAKLVFGAGKDVAGTPVIVDLEKMPHLLIAGGTGAGKSMGINSIICSILFKASPDDVRFLLIDPKRVELACYAELPHLIQPVVSGSDEARQAILDLVEEMECRFFLLKEGRAKGIAEYNKKAAIKLPHIVMMVDELASLIRTSSKDLEEALSRLAAMGRATGIHIILATQRPSVDVLTGMIKANMPSRIAFKVASSVDSRIILDTGGAENLLGKGDMLLTSPGQSAAMRVHGMYISEEEVKRIVEYWRWVH